MILVLKYGRNFIESYKTIVGTPTCACTLCIYVSTSQEKFLYDTLVTKGTTYVGQAKDSVQARVGHPSIT